MVGDTIAERWNRVYTLGLALVKSRITSLSEPRGKEERVGDKAKGN